MANEEGHSDTQRCQKRRFVLDGSEHHDSKTQQDGREHLDETSLGDTRPGSQANIDFHRPRECAGCNTRCGDASNDLSNANGDGSAARYGTNKIQCKCHLGEGSLVSFLNHRLSLNGRNTYSWIELAPTDTIEQPAVDGQRDGEAQADVDDSQCVGFNGQAIPLRRVVGNLTAGECKEQEKESAHKFPQCSDHVVQNAVRQKPHDGTRIGKAEALLEVVSWVRHVEGGFLDWDVSDLWLIGFWFLLMPEDWRVLDGALHDSNGKRYHRFIYPHTRAGTGLL